MEAPADDTPLHLNDLLPTTPDGREERLDVLKRLFSDLFPNEGRLNPDKLKQLVAPNDVHEASATNSSGMARQPPSAKPHPHHHFGL